MTKHSNFKNSHKRVSKRARILLFVSFFLNQVHLPIKIRYHMFSFHLTCRICMTQVIMYFMYAAKTYSVELQTGKLSDWMNIKISVAMYFFLLKNQLSFSFSIRFKFSKFECNSLNCFDFCMNRIIMEQPTKKKRN